MPNFLRAFITNRGTPCLFFTNILKNGNLLAGKISSKKEKLIIAWIEIHQEDLLVDWELAVNGQVPFKIGGLDQ